MTDWACLLGDLPSLRVGHYSVSTPIHFLFRESTMKSVAKHVVAVELRMRRNILGFVLIEICPAMRANDLWLG